MATLNAPSLGLLALEPTRGLYELGLGTLLSRPLARVSPKGDGHPVLVLPGLGAHDMHTYPLRRFLERLDYQVLPWQQGFNIGPREGLARLLTKLADRVVDATAGTHDKVSLVGWSLGGVYAREIAKLLPGQVRQVITLGSPFAGHPRTTNATWLYELLSGQQVHADPALLRRVRQRPPTPVTSIYSKTDGVVAWHCSVQEASDTSESVEVPLASHLGLISNPLVHYIVADRLAQPDGQWQPFCGKRALRRHMASNRGNRLYPSALS